MATTTQLITAEELSKMPDDGFRYELVKGELRKMPPAGHQHGKIAMLIAIPLGKHVLDHKLGMVYAAETGFLIARDPDMVRAPDVSFVRHEVIDKIGEPDDAYWPGAPDLAVEVISPNDTYTEVEEKVSDWLEAGTRMVIVINPRRRDVKVYRSITDVKVLTEQDTLDGADVVPGWKMDVRELFV
ncbi:MAG TPA: Uma2 family endonuclease [Blastocatellia bacterium]|nr:Uma2 family endonuclease [Blastocatellia bacterium]